MNATSNPFFMNLRRLFTLALLALLPLAGRAQQLEDSVFTLGTVTQDKAAINMSIYLTETEINSIFSMVGGMMGQGGGAAPGKAP